VIVEGVTFMPSVYHANAASELEAYSPIADKSMVEPVALRVVEERNALMFAACKAYPEDTSRSFLGSGRSWPLVKPAAAVTPLEYAVLIGRPSEEAEKKAARTNPLVEPKLATKKKMLSFQDPPFSPTFVDSRGSVFGVSDDEGNWRFFVQKIVTSDSNHDVVLRCAEFWPGGFARLPW
jgi:hypothetical protein